MDQNGYFYLVGETSASKLPTTAGVIQPTAAPLGSTGTYVEACRGFVAKFSPVTSAGGVIAGLLHLPWREHWEALGDYISGITIDSASNAYIVGYTNSPDFPVTSGVYSTVCGPNGQNCAAAHVTKLNPTGTAILWSTFVGDAKGDASDALFFTGPIQLDGNGNVYIVAQDGGGSGFPMVNPVELTPTGGAQQVLVAELDPTGSKLLFSTTIGSNGLETSNPAGLAVDSAGDIYLAGNTVGPGLITTPGAFQTTASNSGCCYHGFVAKIAPGPAAPAITQVQNAFGGSSTIAPNTWVKILGSNLAPAEDSRTWQGSDFTGSLMPTQLDGVSATVNGKSAYVEYISSSQVNILTSPDAISGLVPVVVTNNGVASASFTVQAAALSPSFFVFDGTHVVAQHVPSYTDVGPATLYPGYTTPAQPGEEVVLYANGFGATSVPVVSGSAVQSGTLATLPVVTIGGVQALVLYAGLAGVGEFQFNVVIPVSTPDGDIPLIATYAGLSTQSGVVITVQN